MRLTLALFPPNALIDRKSHRDFMSRWTPSRLCACGSANAMAFCGGHREQGDNQGIKAMESMRATFIALAYLLAPLAAYAVPNVYELKADGFSCLCLDRKETEHAMKVFRRSISI